MIRRKQYPDFEVEEGCLSIPGAVFRVTRYKRIIMEDDVHGEKQWKNKLSQVIQHELDHTMGITLVQVGEQIIVEDPRATSVTGQFYDQLDGVIEEVSAIHGVPADEIKEMLPGQLKRPKEDTSGVFGALSRNPGLIDDITKALDDKIVD